MKKAGSTAILCLLVCSLAAGLLSCEGRETQTGQTQGTTQTESDSRDTRTDTDTETDTGAPIETEDMDSFWTPIV